MLRKLSNGFAVAAIKATETVSNGLFKEMDRFEQITQPAIIEKTLIFGGNQNETRTNYKVTSWKNI